MTKTAVFRGPYGGEETRQVRKSGAAFRAHPPGYVAKRFSGAEAAERYMTAAFSFVRWA